MRTRTTLNKLVLTALLCTAVAIAAPVSRVTNFVDGNVLTASQLNSEFNNVIGGVNSINNAQLATNAQIAPSKIAGTIKGDGINRDGSTGALSVKTDNVTTEISGDNIQVKDDGITQAKLADDSVGTDQIIDDAVTADKLADNAVNTANIVDGAVTQTKRAALNLIESLSSGAFSTTSTSAVDVTNLSISITTTGRPVFIGLVSTSTTNGNTNLSYFGLSSNGASATGGVYLLRDSSVVANVNLAASSGNGSSTNMQNPCSTFSMIETPTAGTYTYKVQARGFVIPGIGTTMIVSRCKLVAYEL